MINATDTAKDMELKERQVIALEKIAIYLEQINLLYQREEKRLLEKERSNNERDII